MEAEFDKFLTAIGGDRPVNQITKEHGRTYKETVGTSQQQIHRIEKGMHSVRFDMAIEICNALDEPMEAVFPKTKNPIANLSKKYGQDFPKHLHDPEFGDKMTDADVEMEELSFSYRLRGGAEGNLMISGKENRRLFKEVQRHGPDPNTPFVVFYF